MRKTGIKKRRKKKKKKKNKRMGIHPMEGTLAYVENCRHINMLPYTNKTWETSKFQTNIISTRSASLLIQLAFITALRPEFLCLSGILSKAANAVFAKVAPKIILVEKLVRGKLFPLWMKAVPVRDQEPSEQRPFTKKIILTFLWIMNGVIYKTSVCPGEQRLALHASCPDA